MDTWYSKPLGVGAKAESQLSLIQTAVVTEIVSADHPDGMGAFLRIEPDDSLYTVYFTPETEQLAHTLGAEPCEQPVDDGYLTFIAGDDLLIEVHYGFLKGIRGRD